MRKAFLFAVLSVCAIWLAGAGCNGTPDPNGNDKPIDISREELIERLNLNSDSVRVVLSLTSVKMKNSQYPNGLNAEADFAFMKPSTVGLFVRKANLNVLVLKTDGDVFDVIEFQDEKTVFRTGKVEYLQAAESEFFDFRPDLLSAAMALERIEPEHAEMSRDDSGDYVLTINRPGENMRKLFVSSQTLLPVRQEVYGRDGSLLLTVDYDKVRKVRVFGDREAYVPSALTITGREKDAYLKIENVDPTRFRVNDEDAFWRAMGHSTRAVIPEGAEVSELQPDGTWRPRE